LFKPWHTQGALSSGLNGGSVIGVEADGSPLSARMSQFKQALGFLSDRFQIGP
jgi:hypothetical protein